MMEVNQQMSTLQESLAAAPTTILVDGQATVRWLFRADRFMEQLSPAQLLAAIDKHTSAN
jgi:hypothetical protein